MKNSSHDTAVTEHVQLTPMPASDIPSFLLKSVSGWATRAHMSASRDPCKCGVYYFKAYMTVIRPAHQHTVGQEYVKGQSPQRSLAILSDPYRGTVTQQRLTVNIYTNVVLYNSLE